MPEPINTQVTVKTKEMSDGRTRVTIKTVEFYDPCPLTYAHTQLVCGHPSCREA